MGRGNRFQIELKARDRQRIDLLLSGDLLVQAYPICLILLEVSRIELTLKLSLALLVLFECDCFCSIPFFQVC